MSETLSGMVNDACVLTVMAANLYQILAIQQVLQEFYVPYISFLTNATDEETK